MSDATLTPTISGEGAASGRSQLRASVMASVLGKAVEVMTLIALATVIPRVMGPADYGRFAVPLTIVTIGSLALTLGGPVVLAVLGAGWSAP